MSDKPKTHGYVDSAALEVAVDCNRRLVLALARVVDGLGRVPAPVLLSLQEAGFALAEQRDALAEMERVRANYKAGVRLPGGVQEEGSHV